MKNLNNQWFDLVQTEALKWNHVIYKITGLTITRRSYVFWSCSYHPTSGTNVFLQADPLLNQFVKKKILSLQEKNLLIENNYAKIFYASRMDNYLKLYTNARKTCCKEQFITNKKNEGFNLFKNLLNSRSIHYNTYYVLKIEKQNYKGKHVKYPILCESHNIIFYYSMQDLNYMTSCPCLNCRIDPKHKNKSVELVKKRNAGRPGQIIRHAFRVKKKYNFTCALSNSKFDLQHHHLDGQNFYANIKLFWQYNGICLCSIIHFDYHFNFLLNHSKITKAYDHSILLLKNKKIRNNLSGGAQVSRYTFLEYLYFLKWDLTKNQGTYTKKLNKKVQKHYSSLGFKQQNKLLGEITLKSIVLAIKNFSLEYKGSNWALAQTKEIFNANNKTLWAEVDKTWQ